MPLNSGVNIPMIFRDIEGKDLPELLLIYVDVFTASPWNENWQYEDVISRLEWLYDTKGFIGIAAESTQGIAGSILGIMQPTKDMNSFQIREFFVRPALQSKGIGEKLISKLEHRLKTENVGTVSLVTMLGSAAMNFYIKNGYFEERNIVSMIKNI
jgi:aminoglycoside 6'-N-acetyltransferase I